MVFSYSGNPAHNDVDAVRFLVGDTDALDPVLQDGEIQYLLNEYGAPLNAAIQACETIVARFSRLVDEKVGQVDVKFSQKAKQYTDMAALLRQRLALNDTTPYAGGLSQSDKRANDANSDRVRPDFTKHMMENHQNSTFIPQSDRGGGSFDDEG